ncbi:transmembrane protein adipocyte-associated 1 homolog isoform X2 [Cajanus cajan]|uniref:transmembrane protein adipocyte-associated 1 homolog isoform X2 n=1 Tax=Cajanus cajan TaxID=3821 RepID=UPI0010FB5A62|nr:transmembrane protein adipocyte-associated 1 homolog isoform X2 [Cajanus cajan]
MVGCLLEKNNYFFSSTFIDFDHKITPIVLFGDGTTIVNHQLNSTISLKKLNSTSPPTKQCPMVPPNPFSSQPISASEAAMSGSGEAQALSPLGNDLKCDGYGVFLVVSSVLFVVYLMVHAKKNLNRLCRGASYVVVSYYALLWLVTLLNLAWSFLQAWQCSSGKEVAWNLLSLFTASGMLCLEISLVAFLLKDNYMNGMEALVQSFLASGIIVFVDTFLKAIYVFGFGVPLFNRNVGSTHTIKWSLWIVHKLLLAAAYGFILFVQFSKWREKLPPRPAFYNYVAVMFVFSVITLFACGLAGIGTGLGNWLYDFTVLCYHSLYLPFLYVTFLADFFQEEDFLLDNAYYSEMKDAGFFDADWE